MPSKLQVYLDALRERIRQAEVDGNWITKADGELINSLITASFDDSDVNREYAEQELLAFEVAAEHGAFDDGDELELVEITTDEDEEDDDLEPGQTPKTLEL